MRHYEAPEVLELGKSTDLTLGMGGSHDDNCACRYTPEDDILQ